jgi:hypothetical protein
MRLITLLSLVALVVSAQLADSVKWELSYKNSIVNGGFEQGKQGWSSTGNSTFRQVTTSTLVGSGKASGYIDFTATAEKLRSDLFVIPNSLHGRTCFARFIYNGGGTSDIRYWVEDQDGVVKAGYGFSGSTNEVISSAATNWTDSRDMNFTCPTSGSLRIVLEAQGNANALYVDDLYVGRPFTYTATDALGGSGNDFTYGDGAATNKRLTWNRGGSNPQVRWNESLSRLEYSNNGTNYAAIGSGGQYANYTNILDNPSFEDGISNYAVTGSATLTQSSTTPAFGTYKAIVDFSAASEYFRNTTQTIPEGLYGKNCLVRFRYQGGGTSDIYYRVTDGTNTLAGYTATSTSFKITSAVTSWTDSLDLAFPCPSSGGLRLELESAGNAAALSIDDIYIGENFRVGTVAQAELVGTIKISGCSGAWSSTSGSYGDYSVNTGCTYVTTGKISNPSTMLPGFNLSGAPGRYWIVATGLVGYTGTALSTCAYRMTDGTDNSLEDNLGGSLQDSSVSNFNFSIEKTTAFSTQFRIQTKRQTGTGTCQTYGQGSADYPLTFKVYRFPLASDTVVSAGVPYQGGSVKYAGATNCNWGTTSTSFANFSADSDCNLASTSGNVAAATKIPGFTVSSLEAGSYMVIANGFQQQSSAGYTCFTRLTDGTNYSATSAAYGGGADPTLAPFTNILYVTYTSKQSNLTFQIQGKVSSGATCIVNGSATDGTGPNFALIPLSPSITMPNLVGSVTSNTTGSERIERASISYFNPTPTVARQSGTWIDTVTESSTGLTRITYKTGIFSGNPSCTCSAEDTLCQISTNNSSYVDVITADFAGAGDVSDYEIICMGPR